MQIDTRADHESRGICLTDFAVSEFDRSRFWMKADRSDADGCWNWCAARANNGYGMFKLGTKVRTAHRLALYLATGYFGEVAQHSCDNRACINPKHLSWGTQKTNIADAVAKGRHGQRRPKPEGAVAVPRRKPRAAPMGCICPPTSEMTCKGPLCPRKAPVIPRLSPCDGGGE
jgi:hypothetical protein